MLDEEQLDDEPDESFELFRLYAALPPQSRNVVPLAEITGNDIVTVAAWALMYRWEQRADQRDARYYARQDLARDRILDRLAYLRKRGFDSRSAG